MPEFDAHCVDKNDNVAIAVRDIAAGETVTVHREPDALKITAVTAVPAGHKIALRSFVRDEKILKYGSVIGSASEEIPAGAHVHVHNLEGLRGRGDKL